MSQEKVDRYKKEKANRRQIMRKQRIMNVVRKCVLTVAALALIGWIGYSAYDTYTANQERAIASVNYDAVNTYLQGLTAETEQACVLRNQRKKRKEDFIRIEVFFFYCHAYDKTVWWTVLRIFLEKEFFGKMKKVLAKGGVVAYNGVKWQKVVICGTKWGECGGRFEEGVLNVTGRV